MFGIKKNLLFCRNCSLSFFEKLKKIVFKKYNIITKYSHKMFIFSHFTFRNNWMSAFYWRNRVTTGKPSRYTRAPYVHSHCTLEISHLPTAVGIIIFAEMYASLESCRLEPNRRCPEVHKPQDGGSGWRPSSPCMWDHFLK